MASKVVKSGVSRPPNAGKGRKKGTPNKFTGAVKEMILKALEEAGGVEYLKKQAEANPGPFLTLVGKVLPLQVTGDSDSPLHTVTEIRETIVDPRSGDG